jgi:hypothetical protein
MNTDQLKDGLTRQERLAAAPDPASIEIDGRDMADFLKLAADLSAQFNFYNFNDVPEGDWSSFFSADITIWAAIISRMDISEYSRRYEQQRSLLYYAATETELPQHRDALFAMVEKLAIRLMDMANKMKQLQQQSSVKNELTKLADDYQRIIQSVNQYRNQPADTREMIISTLKPVHDSFAQLLTSFNRLSGIAAYYLSTHPVLEQQYPPHLGLYITFLRLYDYLRVQINQVTQKHLDFYYRDILHMRPHRESPDQVHVLFEPDLNTHELLLAAGEELLAEVPGIDDPVKYRLLQDIVVTKAQVEKLQTLFIGEHPFFSGDDVPAILKNTELYSSVYSSVKPDVFLKEKELLSSRPLFGEDQSVLSANERTMDDATIGLLVASPLLYLTGGKRTIRLTFQCEQAGYKLFNDYIDAFAKAAKKNRDAVFNEVLMYAFAIHFTAPGGWETARKPVKLVLQEDGIQLLVDIEATEKSFSRYDPLIHGDQYPLSFPALRLLINHDSPHNAYSLLRYLVVERLHLQVDVEEFRDVKIQNNVGQLSPLNPVQVFGPQPFVGAYFDIRNTNIFNRYTTAAAVHLEWLELPKQPGGFKTHFAAYNAGIKNESFKTNIRSITGGRVRPVTGEEQQVHLFETTQRGDLLSDYTHITGIDLKKLEYANEPLLEKEENEAMFNNGVLRLELAAPAEAFGHRLYPIIFPEIALHNSRRFNKKLPLPEQPYIPKVKQVTVNYTLVHAEAFKEDNNTSVELIHLLPFGYKKIYPGTAGRTLLPQFEHPGNLHIGLRQLQPGSELRLLFQLEESNFHHTVREMKPVVWSYLYDDTWKELPKSYVQADATNNFINTGIIKLKIPADINTQHTVCDDGLYWLRVAATSSNTLGSKVLAIFAQAAVAERIIDTGHPVSSDYYLPAACIKGLVHKILGIRNTWQLFPSFNGRAAETDARFYARVSERLRHKQRPVTASDIEQFVLEKFSSIAMVKCFGTSGETQPIYPGADMLVVVIPKERADGGFDSEQPRVNLATLFAIRNYLLPFMSPFVNLEVGNPVYEKVKIACAVRFVSRSAAISGQAPADSGFYLKQLQEDIKTFFCPWLYNPGAVIKIGTRVYLSGLLAWLKNLPYIETITGFSVVHFFREKDPTTGALRAAVIDSAVDQVDFVQGSVPEAVLIPSDHHLITVMNDWEYQEPLQKGIRDFLIGHELLISDRKYVPPPVTANRPGSREDPDEYFNFVIPEIGS